MSNTLPGRHKDFKQKGLHRCDPQHSQGALSPQKGGNPTTVLLLHLHPASCVLSRVTPFTLDMGDTDGRYRWHFCHLAAVRGKITSDNHLHTNGCGLPKQFLLFPKDIGKKLLPPGSLHPSGLLGCLYRWCRQQAPWCSRFRAMRTRKK